MMITQRTRGKELFAFIAVKTFGDFTVISRVVLGN